MSADDPTVSPTETEPALPKVVRVPLDKLVLDPNNPRIRDRIKPWPVPRERWADVGVQKEVARALRGPSGRELDELINNLRMFGWLDVAAVRVQALEGEQFLVLDGNRRVEALRECVTQNRDALLTVQQSVLPLRNGLLCLQVPMISDLAQKLTRAHTHLSGSGAWSAYQRAMVMLSIWRDAPWGSVLAAEALSVPKAEFEQMVSAAALCEQYQASAHGGAFDEGQFGIFLQSFASDGIPRWIEWSSTSRSPRNEQNTKKLFRWISTYSGLSQDAHAPLAAMPVLAVEGPADPRPTQDPPWMVEIAAPTPLGDAEPGQKQGDDLPVPMRGATPPQAASAEADLHTIVGTTAEVELPSSGGVDSVQVKNDFTQAMGVTSPQMPNNRTTGVADRIPKLEEDNRPLAQMVYSDPISAPSLKVTRSTGTEASFVPRNAISILHDPAFIHTLRRAREDMERTLSQAINSLHRDFSALGEVLTRSEPTLSQMINDAGSMLSTFHTLRSEIAHRLPAPRQSNSPWKPLFEGDQAHLSTLTVAQYRSLTGLKLDGLGRINLIVGENNSGKTSVLEAISLLMRQSDPREVLDALRRRARWDITKDAEWASQELPAPVQITAQLSGIPAQESSVTLTRSTEPPESAEDRVMFLCSLANESRAGEHTQRSTIDIWAGKEPKMEVHGDRFWLGPSVFHSPFSSSDPETLQRANERAIQLGVKDRLMQFLRDEIDGDLKSIELVRDHRFRVSHNKRADSPDLSSFGDGLQRAFQIGLHLAASAGGVLLIDELENALHTSLLIPFTRLIQELAVEFNVQVFITTHSKETVDAFLYNDYRTEDIVAYGLPARGSGEAVRRYVGPSLRKAIDAIDLDIRW